MEKERPDKLGVLLQMYEERAFSRDAMHAATMPRVALRYAQFLISTHSPIILSYPGAVLFSLDGDSIREITHQETDHYQITRDFLNAPERYFRHLFGTSGDEGDSN